MPFPEAKRVIYKKNPLDRVICQLRFPPILRIDTEMPSQFQESIRKDFPGFCEKQELDSAVPQRMQQEFPGELLRLVMPGQGKNYEFSSEDGNWTVNLTRNFVALSTKKYLQWEAFKKRLRRPRTSLVDIYSPAHFSRIGLRYVNIIKRSQLHLDDVEWTKLLKPHVLGLLGSPDVNKSIQSLEAKYLIQLQDGRSLARIGMCLVESQEKGEKYLQIDTDFFTADRTPLRDVEKTLEYFHVRSSRLIQWLMTKRLHDAMEPETL